MALQDFIKKLKEQDDSDVVYSKPPEQTIKIIPPEKPTSTIEIPTENIKTNVTKVIPPDNPAEPEHKPTVIRFKLNSSKANQQKVVNVPVQSQPVKTTPIIQPKPSTNEPVKQQSRKEVDTESLFLRSGTEMNKRALWYEYYEKAKVSKKQNSVVERMKLGKFAITQDDKVLILPDYDLSGKSTSDILQDKWLKN